MAEGTQVRLTSAASRALPGAIVPSRNMLFNCLFWVSEPPTGKEIMPIRYDFTDDYLVGIDGELNWIYGDTEASYSYGVGGDDTFIGGDYATNVFFGDTRYYLYGSATGGDDVMTGGYDSENRFFGDGSELRHSAVGGDDILTGGDESDNRLIGDVGWMRHTTIGGNDTLNAGDGRGFNVLWGDAYALLNQSTGGDDLLQSGNDSYASYLLYGDAGALLHNSRGGDDTLVGGDGNSLLYGDAISLPDSAQGGDDRLISGSGSDYMFGDAFWTEGQPTTGADTFAFSENNGDDFIFDFEKGKDVIEVQMPGEMPLADKLPEKALANISSRAVEALTDEYAYSELVITEQYFDGHGDSSVVYFDAENSVTLYGVTDLSESDFVFV